MTLGDWVQSIVAGIGILATLLVARMVYRLESRDREVEKEKQELSNEQREEKRRKEEEERERRTLRREQHKDDYKHATAALEVCEQIFEAAMDAPLSRDQLKEKGLEDAMSTLDRVGKRVHVLADPLDQVWFTGSNITLATFPGEDEFRRAAKADESTLGERLATVVREGAVAAVKQYEAARLGMKRIKAAREAISKEWGA